MDVAGRITRYCADLGVQTRLVSHEYMQIRGFPRYAGYVRRNSEWLESPYPPTTR